MKTKLFRRIGLSVVTAAAFILLSPKWLFPPAAWAAPFLLIFLIADLKAMEVVRCRGVDTICLVACVTT